MCHHFTPYPASRLRHNIFSLDDQHTGFEAGPVGQFEKSRIHILARRPTVMRLHLFYSVTPGSCWYCTVKRAVPPIRGEGKSVQISGALRSATEPRARIYCTSFGIQQVRPCWEPKKLFHWGPNPLSAALNKSLKIFKESNSHLKIMGARKVT